MPMMGDGDSLSDVNKPFKSEMEEEKESGTAEKCGAISELADSSHSADGERIETVDTELISDAMAENESPVVVADEVAASEEGGGETTFAQSEGPPIETKPDEESDRAGDAEGEEAVVTDSGERPMHTQPKIETMGDESLAELKLETESIEEITHGVDAKSEMVVSQPEAKIEIKAEQDFTQVVDVSDTQQVSEIQMNGMGAFDDKAEGQVSDVKNNKAAVEVENQTVDRCVVENFAVPMAASDIVNEEKVDAAVSGSEVWDAEKAVASEEEKPDDVITEKVVGIEEEKPDAMITEDIPITEDETDVKMITEVNASAVGTREQEQIPESSTRVEDTKEGVIFATKIMEHESMTMDLLEDPTLDEPVNSEENKNAVLKEDCLLEEDPEEDPEEDTEQKTETEAELEFNDVLKEAPLADAEVVTADDTVVVDDKSPDDDGKMDTEETNSDDADEPSHELYDSPAALEEEEDEAIATEVETGTQDTEMDIPDSEKSSGGKRKRGKLSKSPSNSMVATRSSSKKAVGEDVCFICFDGGELVLCDRRGCPKAYHPSCVNRDEAFFKSKGRWNCGWHLCSICEKNARYMCYTCTFSLCKSCTKDATILCVRGNKGFCETCMKTVKLIENNEQGNENTQIDFNDRSSWEYLFKDYYIELKAKLSLSSVDIAEAKNSWKGADISPGPSKRESSKAHADTNDRGSGSGDSIENIETIRPKRRKTRKQSKALSREYDLGFAAENNSEWASKELLEFVSHMRDGDTTFLSQFDVQALLLEYIKRNKLRDPRRKSQIICDARLENLFGKPRVGHFEMLKLLESHFLVRDEQNDDFQGSVVDTENNLLDVDGNADPTTKGVKDRKRKSRKKSDRGPQSNLDDYAAIDMHNIGLIYLRRKLMEDLLEDAEMFRDKVVGTFVRIRISGSNQKQDLYRLVPVVGTSKGAEPYKIGKKSTDTMVEILNLDKTEIISIDTISNQEFTEEECKRLRQSIKCGLISRLTVGEILDKTVEIQTARVNDWLESEVLRLSHLRDRASDLGRRKELRECVEKLQLLKTPEERRRRLDEIPDIHADPKMDPSYESDDNDSENEDSRRDAFMRSKGISRRARAPISPGSDNPTKPTNKIWESSKYASGSSFSVNPSHIGEIVNENSWNLEREKEREESGNLLAKQNFVTNTELGERSPHPVSRFESFPDATPSTVASQAPLSAGAVENAVKINESEKMWHYKDPSGKVQGPFSMVQLRKWNNTGYFPADLKIWRVTEKEDNSMPLADALIGKFSKELPVVDSINLTDNKERAIMDHNSGSLPRLSAEKWRGNDTTNLPSPTPKQGKVNNSGWHEEERSVVTGKINQTPIGVNGPLSSPTPVIPNMGTLSSAASVIHPVVQTAPFSPTPNSQLGTMANSGVSLHAQSNTTSEVSPHAKQMHARGPATGQQQGYYWSTPNVQNSPGSFSNAGPGPTTGLQPDIWRPAQTSQPNIPPPVTQNATWGAWPAENNNTTPVGARPENPNMGWGTLPPNQNMGGGSGNLPPVNNNNNMNWGPPPMPVPMPGGYGNPSWGTPPVQGNGWGPPSGNVGSSLPAAVQGNPNQGFGSWGGGGGGEPNHMGGQFSGHRGGRGYSGGPRPWNNRQSSFVGSGGGGFRKGDMVCPYNMKGRCRKGLLCDYMHT